MKKVRFESPIKDRLFKTMEERDCHSPRPFSEKQIYTTSPDIYNYPKLLTYSNDPVQLFECSNSSPYPLMNKTNIYEQEKGQSQWSPCNDLELSMLDATYHEPRKPASILKPSGADNVNKDKNITGVIMQNKLPMPVYNHCNTGTPPNLLLKDDFFLKRHNLGKVPFDINPVQQQFNKVPFDINPVQQQFNRICIDKENNPLAKKVQIMQMSALSQPKNKDLSEVPSSHIISSNCMCHHCNKNMPVNVHNVNKQQVLSDHHTRNSNPHYVSQNTPTEVYCPCSLPPIPSRCVCCDHVQHQHHPQNKFNTSSSEQSSNMKINAVDKKTWAIEKYEQSKKSDSMEVEKQTNIKEKREPTVSDLFKIIKLQNEQLQLLQEKVDKFISNQQNRTAPVQNCISEQVTIENHSNEHHKMSIGVMTSFEMVRTSTIINKEVLKTNENSQIQSTQSQISIKEVLSNVQSPNLNFLDGIPPMSKFMPDKQHNTDDQNLNEEKTLNELSLYNVQVDNATTPLMSPEQSLYLDVRDYSESDAESDDQSNVGWTYYNKVMTHVNGMLQDSDMPSSASALYRNTRQKMQTLQMQIDKTNVSVTKRVKFGDDPLGIHQPHIYAGSTDTSLKMNQLAAKYLKGAAPAPAPPQQLQRPTTAPIDMSFATRNYMERHKLLQGVPAPSRSPLQSEMPRFLDITALKQQPKFL